MLIIQRQMYINLADIKEIQVDHTTRCNLFCGQCARTENGWSLEPRNMNIDLTLADYRLLLEPFPENKINVFHCGNYGDALASPTFDETFNFTLSKNPLKVTVSTNGTLRTPSWWAKFAETGGERLRVTFAIDGLEDTNAIYRDGANWNRIMQNVTAFIGAGGHARWDFIEFEHNYHQIAEAEELATKLGFEKFNTKYTARFATLGKKTEVNFKGGVLKDCESNVNQKDFKEIKNLYGSFDDYVQRTPIACKTRAEKKVFVDMHMRLWPCCWFGAPLYFKQVNKQKADFEHLEQTYGADFNSLRKHGWNVLGHEFFQSHLQNSWDKPDQKHRRIYTCGRTCGEKFEFSSGYGQNSNIKVIQT